MKNEKTQEKSVDYLFHVENKIIQIFYFYIAILIAVFGIWAKYYFEYSEKATLAVPFVVIVFFGLIISTIIFDLEEHKCVLITYLGKQTKSPIFIKLGLSDKLYKIIVWINNIVVLVGAMALKIQLSNVLGRHGININEWLSLFIIILLYCFVWILQKKFLKRLPLIPSHQSRKYLSTNINPRLRQRQNK